EQRPLARDSLELVVAVELELEAGSDDGSERRARHQDLTRLRKRGDARRDVDGHPADVVADVLALAGVHAGAHLDAELLHARDDLARAADRDRRRASPDREERVADRLDLDEAEAIELLAHDAVVRREQVAPARI